MEETMRSSLRLPVVLVATLVVGMVEGGSNFADNLAECSAVQELNICLREVCEDQDDVASDDDISNIMELLMM